jgi:hypothetical protein
MRNRSIGRIQDDRFKRCESDEAVDRGVWKAGEEKQMGTRRRVSIAE